MFEAHIAPITITLRIGLCEISALALSCISGSHRPVAATLRHEAAQYSLMWHVQWPLVVQKSSTFVLPVVSYKGCSSSKGTEPCAINP